MWRSPAFRRIILLWLVWAVVLSGFQVLVQARFQPQRPDYALPWTGRLTGIHSQNDKPYLIHPFLNEHVSFDSIFYISIALVGYDDPVVPPVPRPGDTTLSMNYAFFPFYPFLMYLVLYPLRIFCLDAIATATLAGVLISLLGALAAMLALFDLTQEELGEAGGLRTAFYLLIFPTGFFLAMVFTEGLFVGLTFSALALIRRRKFGWAALLAALATWTRAVGFVLVVPLALAVLYQSWSGSLRKTLNWTFLRKGVYVLIPLAAMGIWMASPWAPRFRYVEKDYFGQGFLQVSRSMHAWAYAFTKMVSGDNTQTTAYYAIEFFTILLALLAGVMLLRRYPTVAVFSLLALTIALTSGAPQSLNRYVLATPATFIFLSRAGKNEVFDRIWTLTSTLLMGLLVTLFTFDMWVA
ncbi:MAG: hypothetical protein ACETWR_23015 [Anaerolineae bacterium]